MRPRVVPESGETKSFRVALYARVSTVHGGQNPEMQLWEMREYCERRNWIIAGEYVDRASGLRDSRPSLNLLFQDATQRKFDSVLVWKLDRFGRSLRHLVNCLAELQALGVKFVSLKDSLDLSTPAGTLMCHVLCCMSQFEASLARERVISGLAHARAKGKRLGRPTKRVDVDKINALRASGHSWRSIARAMKLSVGTVYAATRSQGTEHAKALCA
jgi:DNA invertase Pin-like site-specific DNA recombinase